MSRRNVTDDQRATLLDSIRERRSDLAVALKLQVARKVKKDGASSMSDNVSGIEQPKSDTRAAVAKEFRIPERKLRTAQEGKKADPDLAKKVREGQICLGLSFEERRFHEMMGAWQYRTHSE